MTRKDDSMVSKRVFKILDFLKGICVVASIIVFGGCAHEYEVTIHDQKVINQGLYEVNSLNDSWLRIPNFGVHRIYDTTNTDDIVYLRCPAQQVIAISRVKGPHLPKKGRSLFASYQEQERYLVEDYNEGAGIIVQESFVYQPIQFNDNDAMEYDYLVSNPQRLCSRVDKNADEVKVKIILTRYWRPFGEVGWLIIIYKSPPETFDQYVAEFDKMVQSFRFTK